MKKKISKVQKVSKKYGTSYPARSKDPLVNLLHWTPMKMLINDDDDNDDDDDETQP